MCRYLSVLWHGCRAEIYIRSEEKKEVVGFITWLATDRGEVLSPIRLVKFLYLADLYYARRNGGNTLTGWPWRFLHYGPFCSQSLDAIGEAVNRGLIATISYESKFDGENHVLYKYQSEREPAIASKLPFYVIEPLQGAVKKWADDTFADKEAFKKQDR